jgi:hypothetical protein
VPGNADLQAGATYGCCCRSHPLNEVLTILWHKWLRIWSFADF